MFDLGTRRGWGVSVTPRSHLTSGKDPVPILQEAGWASVPVWTGAENLAPTGIWSPDRPARWQSLYRLRYPAPNAICILLLICSKIQPDDDPIGSKHVAVWILYNAVFGGYLFNPYFIIVSALSVVLAASVMTAQSESYVYCPHEALGK